MPRQEKRQKEACSRERICLICELRSPVMDALASAGSCCWKYCRCTGVTARGGESHRLGSCLRTTGEAAGNAPVKGSKPCCHWATFPLGERGGMSDAFFVCPLLTGLLRTSKFQIWVMLRWKA